MFLFTEAPVFFMDTFCPRNYSSIHFRVSNRKSSVFKKFLLLILNAFCQPSINFREKLGNFFQHPTVSFFPKKVTSFEKKLLILKIRFVFLEMLSQVFGFCFFKPNFNHHEKNFRHNLSGTHLCVRCAIPIRIRSKC